MQFWQMCEAWSMASHQNHVHSTACGVWSLPMYKFSTLLVLKMSNMLGILYSHGSNDHQFDTEVFGTRKFSSPSSAPDWSLEGLLESQSKCNIIPKWVNVPHCWWNGPKYYHSAKDEVIGERSRREVCENSFVWHSCTWSGSILGCMNWLLSQAWQQSGGYIYNEYDCWCQTSMWWNITSCITNSSRQLRKEEKKTSTCLLYVMCLLDWDILQRWIWVFFLLRIHARTSIRDLVPY